MDCRLSHSFSITNSRGAASLKDFASELAPHIRAVELEEVLKADTIILAVMYTTVPELAGVADWQGKTVIDATNAIDFSDFSPSDLGGRLSSEIVGEVLPGARVVKAFNTLPAALLGEDPAVSGGRRVLFVSGDDASAKKGVTDLVESLGYAAVDLGTLEDGRNKQFGGPLMTKDLILRG
jgi:8-hydroxy-5-deazaflavin:NADPH oxidoreductase